ncbi:hypothetical protein GRI62_07905 [Erythrobacter arachoides]|uniref:Sulfatase N-terminal domain-containing protein n=1 Tax=Aurantiacibacter arachoides TaxID=1850444 RepID=A0A845A0Q5_9SPHN|nr:hypothetical protein [Aurantiacibacter arachoides]MXO93528.1 hypothetical protein [Aurantiacibacter arachoides]GGD48663.1 nodulation protein NoeB [Aurantiacibacter arachoides]
MLFAASLAAGLAGFFNLLNYHAYPLFRPEVAVVVAGIVAVAFVLAALRGAIGSLLGAVMTGLVVAIAADLSAEIDLGWFYALWLVLAVIAFLAEPLLLKMALAMFGTVALFQFVTLTTGLGAPVRPDNSARVLQSGDRPMTDRPAIVHLVLDSYLGLGGMDLGPEHYTQLRAEQSAFFAQRGFQTYPGAYSRHVKTVNSLPYLFSYGTAPFGEGGVDVQYAVADELAYFTDLDTRGYRTSVLQPTYLDMCVNQPLTRCRKYERSDLAALLDTDLTAVERARIMGFTLLQLTGFPSRAAEALQLAANDAFELTGRRPYNRAKLLPLAAVRQFDRFIDELPDLQRGKARVAHLLLPHDPYILDPQCRAKPEREWLDEHGPGTPAARERAYADQVRCVQGKIAAMLDALDRTAAGREAIVLIHGDHGSRISPYVPYIGGPQLTDRELLMAHSAFFAIRVPGEPAAELAGSYALETLMADFRARDFRSAPRPLAARPAMLLMNARSVPTERRALPVPVRN